MSRLIHDSFFGRGLRWASKGKLLPHEETKNPALIQQYLPKQSASTVASDESSPERPPSDTSTLHGTASAIAEKGTDLEIVGWYGDDDPEVR
jgi:hypothetical protein